MRVESGNYEISSCCRASIDGPRPAWRKGQSMTKNDELVVATVNPSKLNYKNPIFERLEEDINNPWVLEEQVKFYKKAGVPIAHFALAGQKKKHYYAVFEGSSKNHADSLNKMNNRESKKKERREKSINEHETDSYDVMLENGYDVPREEDSPDEIVAMKILLDVLNKEYQELSEEKKRICDTVKEGMTQRDAAKKLGMARRTYRDHKDAVMRELKGKLK